MADDDLLGSMYDDEVEAPANIDRSNARTRRIRVGIIEYEVPTVDYVLRLEQTVRNQGVMLEQQRQAITRLQATLIGTRRHMQRGANDLSDFRATLNRKVDHS